MGHMPNDIDIYSASWGPTDDGRTVDGPRNMTMRAIVKGVNEGRHGLGNIYVWASGDGGPDDDCNCDGYAASMWTISINSATNDGQTAGYDESCSSTLASTFSNGKSTFRDAGVVCGSYLVILCYIKLFYTHAFTLKSFRTVRFLAKPTSFQSHLSDGQKMRNFMSFHVQNK